MTVKEQIKSKLTDKTFAEQHELLVAFIAWTMNQTDDSLEEVFDNFKSEEKYTTNLLNSEVEKEDLDEDDSEEDSE